MLQGLDLVWSLLTLLRQGNGRHLILQIRVVRFGERTGLSRVASGGGARCFHSLSCALSPAKQPLSAKAIKSTSWYMEANLQLPYFSHKQKSMQPTVGTHYSFILNSAWSSWCLCLSEEWNHYPGNAKGKKNVIQKEYLLLVTKCLEHTAILQSLPIWIFCFFSNKIVFWQFSQNDGISCDLSFVWFVDLNRISKMSSFRKRIPKC